MHDTLKPTAEHHHSPPQGFLWTHVFSLDHKVIGKQYYFLSLAAVLIGMVLSWLVRFHLAWASAAIPGLQHLSQVGAPGGIITPEYYLSLLTLHGTLMVFFVLTTAPQAGFGNYFLPIQIGAEDMAFPRLNMLSFWVTFVGFVVLISTLFVGDGPPISGWTAYAPLSAIGSDAGPGLGTGQVLWVISIGIFCIGSLLGALNFIATTLDLRAKGMTLARMPYTTWAWFITAVLGLLAFAVLPLILIVTRIFAGLCVGHLRVRFTPESPEQEGGVLEFAGQAVVAQLAVVGPAQGLPRPDHLGRFRQGVSGEPADPGRERRVADPARQ